MGKRKNKTSGPVNHLFSCHSSYSVAEIMAAGGTTAFANRLGKNPKLLAGKLHDLQKNAYLTEDEANISLKTLKDSK